MCLCLGALEYYSCCVWGFIHRALPQPTLPPGPAVLERPVLFMRRMMRAVGAPRPPSLWAGEASPVPVQDEGRDGHINGFQKKNKGRGKYGGGVTGLGASGKPGLD